MLGRKTARFRPKAIKYMKIYLSKENLQAVEDARNTYRDLAKGRPKAERDRIKLVTNQLTEILTKHKEREGKDWGKK